MLNSDRDLDLTPNRYTTGSPWQSLGAEPSISIESSIERSNALSIFAEACDRAVLLSDAPVAIVTTVGGCGYQIGAISGAQHLVKLPANPNLPVELGGLEYCHDRIVTTGSKFTTECQQHPQLSGSALYLVHGIRAYLGVPIITAAGDRLGTISLLDVRARHFSNRDADLLQLVGDLVASEFERSVLSQAQLVRSIGDLQSQSIAGFDDRFAASEHCTNVSRDPRATYPCLQGEIQFKLLAHLAQELRTPLTSILGMASVLQQEIYGSLSGKQKDYLGIVYHSGQQLVALVDEIAQLGGFDRPSDRDRLHLKSVDLEMLCQSALRTLEPIAKKKHQQLILDLAGDVTETTAPACRIWLLDKDKVKKIIYYLCLSAIHASASESCISLELVNLPTAFQLQICSTDTNVCVRAPGMGADLDRLVIDPPVDGAISRSGADLRVELGLALAHLLALAHGGNIEVNTRGSGYCLTLPLLVDGDRSIDRP